MSQQWIANNVEMVERVIVNLLEKVFGIASQRGILRQNQFRVFRR